MIKPRLQTIQMTCPLVLTPSCEGLGRSGFQPSDDARGVTWADGLGWDGAAPLALVR